MKVILHFTALPSAFSFAQLQTFPPYVDISHIKVDRRSESFALKALWSREVTLQAILLLCRACSGEHFMFIKAPLHLWGASETFRTFLMIFLKLSP